MSSQLSSRRTACNRCRSHKLRCIRVTGSNNSLTCQRCLRVGTLCITSAVASLGRSETVGQKRRQRESLANEEVNQAELTRQEGDGQGCEIPVLTPASTMVEYQTDTEGSSIYPQSPTIPIANPANSPKPMTTIEEDMVSRYQGNASTNYPSLDILDPSLIQSLPPPLDTREECVRKLAGLHSSLILDLNTARGCRTADKCTKIINMPEFSHTYNFPIGRMLSASAKLIEILQYFERPKTPSHEVIRCDAPTVFSIFTCYVYLIRIYRLVLMSILKSISDKTNQPQELPPLFPGLHLGGYSLEPHINVQVNLLVQTSQMMLSKIDDAMGLSSEGKTGMMSCCPGSIDFLQSMIEKEMAEDCIEEVLAGDSKASLTQIIAELKKACLV